MPAQLEEIQLDKIVAVRLNYVTHQQLLKKSQPRGLSQTLRLIIDKHFAEKPEAPTKI
jgi:hypothetical protein